LTTLPITPEGATNVLAHVSCVKKLGMYCERHQEIHQGFWDKTTVCMSCVTEELEEKKPLAEVIYQRLRSGLPTEQLEDIEETAGPNAEAKNETVAVWVFRLIIARAQRYSIDIEEVVKHLLQDKDTAIILGPGWLEAVR